MRGVLPSSIIDRSKSGFGMPLRRWMRGELRELIGDILNEEALVRRGIFAPEKIRKLTDNHQNKTDGSTHCFQCCV